MSKNKTHMEFDPSVACSIKSLAFKKNDVIKLTTRFSSGKMLMFAKESLERFACEFTETFFFPN